MIDYLLEISYPTDREDLDDLVSTTLYLFGCGGSSSLDNTEGGRLVTAYFETVAQRTEVDELLGARKDLVVRSVDRARQDWLAHYQQSLIAIPVGRRFIVAPERALIRDFDRIPLIIPQEQAFGTGSHETTALCLEMLEGIDHGGIRGLDVGTGSAILAIAMCRLGAREVVAFDNDLEAIPPALGNLERNGIGRGSLFVFCGTLPAVTGAFEVVTMNILPEVILPLLPDVRKYMISGGSLVLSGILISRSDEVISAAGRYGLQCIVSATRGEWWCGRFGQS